MKILKVGDTCWIIENNIRATPCEIKRITSDFYTIALPNGAVINLSKHRIYESYIEAVKNIKRKEPERKYKNPYEYLH